MKFPFTLIDLTHTIDQNIPTWEGRCGFTHSIQQDYDEKQAVKFRVGRFEMPAGIGTHLDAPAHCIPGALTVEQIPLAKLLAPCVMLDVSRQCHEHYCVSTQDIENFEKQFFTIPPGVFVMIKTGWEQFWQEPEKYRNNYLFPSVSKEAALMLLEKKVCGLGIDTLSPDCPASGFPVHQLFLQSGKWLVENAANLNHLPTTGSYILPVPIKVKEATEAPIRLIAFNFDFKQGTVYEP